MKGFLIDVQNDKAREVDIKDGNHLRQFYDLIGCRCIDITCRTIGGKPYNIVLDDEGLLVDRPILSAFGEDMRPMLAGNLVIFNMGPEMDLADLTEEDIANIKANTYELADFDSMELHPVVIMDY